ncbi:hypothetical protein QLX08_011298 [Tetragonisca angustula]|uniref:Uncharacterized protein n=1 Tax=Tetragonisca angustula TaxID=166442 RepID=A0AAW0Z9F7_9HYME
MAGHIRIMELFFKKHGLEVNEKKCAVLQNVSIPGTKRLVVDTQPYLDINGTSIPTLGVVLQMKYLGYNYAFCGAVTPTPAKNGRHARLFEKEPAEVVTEIELQRYLIPK